MTKIKLTLDPLERREVPAVIPPAVIGGDITLNRVLAPEKIVPHGFVATVTMATKPPSDPARIVWHGTVDSVMLVK